eukprot:Blabericola_migrator_1__6730@NODE_33_length_18162_cov_161_418900_g29_i0_p4_GENE_NODE_33_length_18162_cov_161_418900_g29_i0NODE_33_length_18162_cov_161_418900_g29_i0_p4_ORF_typecomplete_len426_score59_75Pribosyltran_N/PF13793_6/1_1e45Pribosyltran_N/PF13793_6/31Pribosyl_synth/PF14572_6/8_3e03Pribosyl_synth/PF14572_6/1_3e41Pribosyltran/PF00156_27/3_2e03Pribosyltran/PF00156_27/2_6e03Pribosyltran/PF00156_27/4_8e14UPRTase/PF14681_6/1_3e05Flavodoxin_3/PF12641_7/2_3e03Flavodoxin_3/PF12641_7/2_5e03Flavod
MLPSMEASLTPLHKFKHHSHVIRAKARLLEAPITQRVVLRNDEQGDDKRRGWNRHLVKGGLGVLGVAALAKSKTDLDRSQELVAQCEQQEPANKLDGAVIFCGSANNQLAETIAKHLGTQLGNVLLSRFADGEISLQFLDSLRGKDVYIIQPTSPPVNENLMELLLMISTCRRSSAKKITAVVPYYGYARQDRKLSSRVPISAADVARMIECMGVDRVISVDLHCGQIQGFFGPRVPVDNLEAQKVGLQYFRNKKLSNPVIVSPDAGGVYRARKFQEGFTAMTKNKATGLAMLIKQRAKANEIEKMELVGQVDGADVIIVDDMIDTAGTLCEAAKMLRSHGAKRIFCFATHGLFSGPAIERITNSALEEVVVSDSIKQSSKIAACPRITQLSIGPLLADAIYHVHKKESIHHVFFDHLDDEKKAN